MLPVTDKSPNTIKLPSIPPILLKEASTASKFELMETSLTIILPLISILVLSLITMSFQPFSSYTSKL